jgi:predicted RNA-binding Zn-ribbon protein involved in translation (DUF1610 family)
VNHQNYSQWILGQTHCGESHDIPVPIPTQKDKIGYPPGMGVTKAAFLCPYCGLVSLYSIQDACQTAEQTPCPHECGLYGLFYIEAGCVSSNCESLTKLHVIRDEQTKIYFCKKPMSEWVVDDPVKCANNHPVKLDPGKNYDFYRCEMPF